MRLVLEIRCRPPEAPLAVVPLANTESNVSLSFLGTVVPLSSPKSSRTAVFERWVLLLTCPLCGSRMTKGAPKSRYQSVLVSAGPVLQLCANRIQALSASPLLAAANRGPWRSPTMLVKNRTSLHLRCISGRVTWSGRFEDDRWNLKFSPFEKS